MTVPVVLTHRQQHILWATVRHYVATAEPVGSKALAEEYNLSVSPATIRSAMGTLEKLGLLYQPHTSAGRIPSDSGYRTYVDQLIKPSDQRSRQVEQVLGQRRENWHFEGVLRHAAQILARLSGYIALITMPQNSSPVLRHLQLVPTDPGRVMLIVVLDNYETRSQLMDLPELWRDHDADSALSQSEQTTQIEQELQILSNFLNHHLRGRSLPEIARIDWAILDQEFRNYADFLRVLLQELIHCARPAMPVQILVNGVSEVLRQPEFSELQQMQALMYLLEEQQEKVGHLIFDGLAPGSLEGNSTRRLTVLIGMENPLEPMRHCALVAATYHRGSQPAGSVGLLGPTRMVYEDAIALVNTTADYLSETLNPL